MAHVFQRPRAPRRAHPGIVLVKNDSILVRNSERREDPGELSPKLAQPSLAGVAMMERERVEMARAFDMTCPVVSRRPCVDEHRRRAAPMGREPLRIDQQFRSL